MTEPVPFTEAEIEHLRRDLHTDERLEIEPHEEIPGLMVVRVQIGRASVLLWPRHDPGHERSIEWQADLDREERDGVNLGGRGTYSHRDLPECDRDLVRALQAACAGYTIHRR